MCGELYTEVLMAIYPGTGRQKYETSHPMQGTFSLGGGRWRLYTALQNIALYSSIFRVEYLKEFSFIHEYI